MPKFPIVDAHVHLHDVKRLSYGWLANVQDQQDIWARRFRRGAGAVVVDKLVFAEVAVDPGLHLSEAAFIQEPSAPTAWLPGRCAASW